MANKSKKLKVAQEETAEEKKVVEVEKEKAIVEDLVTNVVVESQETTPEFVLAGREIDCVGLPNISLTIMNTGEAGLVYQVLGSNIKELTLTNKIKDFAPLAKGEIANYKAENLSWKYIGVYVESEEPDVPTTVKILAYPFVNLAILKKLNKK